MQADGCKNFRDPYMFAVRQMNEDEKSVIKKITSVWCLFFDTGVPLRAPLMFLPSVDHPEFILMTKGRKKKKPLYFRGK